MVFNIDDNPIKAGDGSTFVKISGSTFISNTAIEYGGAVVNSVIGGNGDKGGSAIALMDISNSTFAANQSRYYGSAVFKLATE